MWAKNLSFCFGKLLKLSGIFWKMIMIDNDDAISKRFRKLKLSTLATVANIFEE